MIDLEKSKAAAMAATDSQFKVTEEDYGDELWFGGEGEGIIYVGGWANGGCKSDDPKAWEQLKAEANHIATANPQAILELITRLREAEKDAAKWHEYQAKKKVLADRGFGKSPMRDVKESEK